MAMNVKVTGGGSGVVDVSGKTRQELDVTIGSLTKIVATNEAHLTKSGWTKDATTGEWAAPVGWTHQSREKNMDNAKLAKDTQIMVTQLQRFKAERQALDIAPN